jgi:hypothetical protein
MNDTQPVEVYQSLIERPLPFYGAGIEVGILCLAIVYTAQLLFGLISWQVLAALAVSYSLVLLVKRWRKYDAFGVESIVIGAVTPDRYTRGTDYLSPSVRPRPTRPAHTRKS